VPVGAVIGSGQIDNTITSLAVQLRDVCQHIYNLDLSVNGQGQGLAYLTSIGYSGDPNPANPGGISDAQLAQTAISYLHTVAGVYFGDNAQTPAYNFNQQLSSVWAGQVGS
jgi:hypothetical protein